MTIIQVRLGSSGGTITISDTHQEKTFELVSGYGLTTDGSHIPVRPANTAAALANNLFRALRPLLKISGVVHDLGETAVLVLEAEQGPVAPSVTGESFVILDEMPELPVPAPVAPVKSFIMAGGRARATSTTTSDRRRI
jgi:hypothetical protein